MEYCSDLIFENYDRYITEHRNEIATPSDAIEMLSSDGSFNAYIASLTEGLDAHHAAIVKAVCDREREFLLEQSSQMGPSANVIGYAVTYFPILADIYINPVLTQVSTIYPTNRGIVTIPKVQVHASITNVDGTTTSYLMPRAKNLVRAAAEEIALAEGASNNLYTLSAGAGTTVSSTLARVNKRYFYIATISALGPDDSSTSVTINVRPDARGQIYHEFTFTDENDVECAAVMIGHIAWDTGVVTYSVTYTPDTFSTVSATANVVFSPKTGNVGRVKVQIKTKGWDRHTMSSDAVMYQ